MNISNFDELYPGRFLKAGLVENKPTYTIKDVNLEGLETEDNKVSKKGIISFTDCEFELTLNKTNGVCLAAMFGKKVANWIGKRVTLCSEQTKFGRETVDAVRICGSPDISEPITVSINMPKRKPVQRTLEPTKTIKDELIQLLNHESLTDEYRNTVLDYVAKNPNAIAQSIAKVRKQINA